MIVQYISFELLPAFSADPSLLRASQELHKDVDKMAFAILQLSLVVFAISFFLRVVLHGKWLSFSGSDDDKPALKPSITFTFLEDSQFSLIKKEWESIQALKEKLNSLKLTSSDTKEVDVLMKKAVGLMTDFEELHKIDMADKYKRIEGESTVKFIAYKDTMLENMRSIKNRLSELLNVQVGKIASDLLNFSVEDGKVINEAETRYEVLLNKGKELLRLMSENEQAFSDENSFVIKKLVDERLPSLHEDYLKSLKTSDDISKPTEIFQQVLDELDTLFTQSELEFNEINAENAIQNLLIQQRYMSNRI